jgi:hypothetical protein
MQIRILVQVAKPMCIHADLDPDPGQALKSQKFEFLHLKIHCEICPVIYDHGLIYLVTPRPPPHSHLTPRSRAPFTLLLCII